ncbi:MAG TPA: FAD-dependent oxidoreductase [Nocardioides sp.]|nr:FAD-dependent oxidoreductase [Nocardioides sp.]
MSSSTSDIVVIGAGIAGLAAARRLAGAGHTTVVLEAAGQPGGRIRTERIAGGHIEHGGIFHTEQYHSFRFLLHELGLERLVTTVPTGFHSRVLTPRGWKHADYGSLTGPALFGGLSVLERARLGVAALPALRRRPRRPEDHGDLVVMADLDERSAAAAVPDAAAELFTAGPHEFLWGTRSEAVSYAMLALQLHVFAGELREVSGGVGQVVDRLASELDVTYGAPVTLVEETPDGVAVHLGDGSVRTARAAVVATTADVARKIWPTAPSDVLRHLDAVTYTRIDYAYLRTDHPVEIRLGRRSLSMEVVPTATRDGRTLGGIYQSNGWVDSGGLLLVTAANAVAAGGIDDADLLARLQADAEQLHPELRGHVVDRLLIRHEHYTPTFRPGMVRGLAAARAVLGRGPIDLAGDHMSAPWVDGAVRSGHLAADRVASRLGGR